jgi:hypothetical protein
LGPEIENHVVAFKIGLRVSLLGVDEVGELDRVSDEENWSVVADHVIVAFFGVEFHCKSSRISLCISAALFTSDSGESREERCSLSNAFVMLGLAVLGNVMCDFEIAPGAGTFSVYNSFRDSFSVEC